MTLNGVMQNGKLRSAEGHTDRGRQVTQLAPLPSQKTQLILNTRNERKEGLLQSVSLVCKSIRLKQTAFLERE